MAIVETTNSLRIAGIRRLVAVGFGSNQLSDDDITDDTFLGEANRYIARRVTGHANLTGDDRLTLEVLVSKKCAAELLKSVARPIDLDSASIGDRQIFLSIEKTIEAFDEDIKEGLEEISPDQPSSADAYFEVIILD